MSWKICKRPAACASALGANDEAQGFPGPFNGFAGDVSRLSDAEVPADEIADLVVALKRAGVLDSGQAASLYGDYLVQTRG